MSAAERTDADVDAELAAEFCRELKLRGEEMKGALASWQAARDAVAPTRDAVLPAQNRAYLAQFRNAANAAELTRRFEEAREEVDRACRELDAATKRVRDAVETAESDASRMCKVTLHAEPAARVARVAFVTTEHARLVRDEAELGPSREDVERRRRAEREAAERTAATTATSVVVEPAPAAQADSRVLSWSKAAYHLQYPDKHGPDGDALRSAARRAAEGHGVGVDYAPLWRNAVATPKGRSPRLLDVERIERAHFGTVAPKHTDTRSLARAKK